MNELSDRGRRSFTPEQLYRLLGTQVKSYHKARHMGENSSVSTELARELLGSVMYTLEQAGGAGSESVEAMLVRGQKLLAEKLWQAWRLLDAVEGSAPTWQGECRGDSICQLRRFLERYDPIHLAHRAPEGIFYPFLSPMSDDMKGIDAALWMLTAFYTENRLIAAFPQEQTEGFWDIFSQNDRGFSENPCERLLINGIGKVICQTGLRSLCFCDAERAAILKQICRLSPAEMRAVLERAAEDLCAWLGISDRWSIDSAGEAVSALLPRLEAAAAREDLSALFL